MQFTLSSSAGGVVRISRRPTNSRSTPSIHPSMNDAAGGRSARGRDGTHSAEAKTGLLPPLHSVPPYKPPPPFSLFHSLPPPRPSSSRHSTRYTPKTSRALDASSSRSPRRHAGERGAPTTPPRLYNDDAGRPAGAEVPSTPVPYPLAQICLRPLFRHRRASGAIPSRRPQVSSRSVIRCARSVPWRPGRGSSQIWAFRTASHPRSMRCGLRPASDSIDAVRPCSRRVPLAEVGIQRDRAASCRASARSARACTVAALHGCSSVPAARCGEGWTLD